MCTNNTIKFLLMIFLAIIVYGMDEGPSVNLIFPRKCHSQLRQQWQWCTFRKTQETMRQEYEQHFAREPLRVRILKELREKDL